MRYTLVLAFFLVFLQTTTSCETACGRIGTLHPCQPGESNGTMARLQTRSHPGGNLAARTLASLEHLRAAITL